MTYDFPNSFAKQQFEMEQRSKAFHQDFDDSFATGQKVFFVFFGIVVTFIGGMFIFAIFLICFKLCRGESFQDYRRHRQFHTVIPPPPPLTNPCNYFQRIFHFVFE